MRRLLDCDGEDLMGTSDGMEVVRLWMGRNGLRCLSGEKERTGGGAIDVGVVEALRETAAEEK